MKIKRENECNQSRGTHTTSVDCVNWMEREFVVLYEEKEQQQQTTTPNIRKSVHPFSTLSIFCSSNTMQWLQNQILNSWMTQNMTTNQTKDIYVRLYACTMKFTHTHTHARTNHWVLWSTDIWNPHHNSKNVCKHALYLTPYHITIVNFCVYTHIYVSSLFIFWRKRKDNTRKRFNDITTKTEYMLTEETIFCSSGICWTH